MSAGDKKENVYHKIMHVMEGLQYLQKDDHVKFNNTNYKALSEEKVTSSIRPFLIENRLVIVPIHQEHKREGTLSTVDVVYRLRHIDGDENDYIDIVSSGTGVDTQDKGVGKAMTYAFKYALLRTFAIPTGEDPDKISSEQLDYEQAKAFKITTEQEQKILDVLAQKGKTLKGLLEHIGIQQLEDATKAQYTQICKILKI